MVPGEPSAEWRKTYFFSLYCHALYSSKASGHLLYQQTSIPWVPIHSGQPDRHTPTSLFRVGAFSPPCTLLSCLRVAVRGGAVLQGWEGSKPLAAKGCGSPRISAWPAGMGSVSSALARSRNTVVQPGSSPPQPEVPLAAPASLKDSRTQRHQGSSRPSLAWEPPLARHSQKEPRKLEGAELSPVLKCLPTMSLSSPSDSPGGEFCGLLLPGDPRKCPSGFLPSGTMRGSVF